MESNLKSVKSGQAGGTILGIIIGLVIGLTIAVVVALMITRTSTPFTNKLGLTKGSDQPTIQLTDPNKPLYGSSAKEIMATANKQGDDPGNAAPPAVQTATGSPAVVAVRPPDAVKADLKPDAANKPVDPKLAKNDADEKPAGYYLQVGAFRDAADAESARAKLALIGVESRISSNTENDNLYRVRIGPFDQLDALNRMRSKLTENSIDVAVIKTPK